MNRRRWMAGGGVGGAAVAVAAVAGLGVGGGSAAAEDSAATAATKTARIERRDLVETEDVDGTLGYADFRTVTNRLTGTVTWLPATGAVIDTNHRLYEVDGKAVYLLEGSTPAWRTLKSGTSGRDVRQLERNLRDLGLDPAFDMHVDGTWDAGTTAAVERWQRRKGLSETGQIELGRVVFQPGRRRIAATSATLGGSAAQSSGGADGAQAASASAATTTGASFEDSGDAVTTTDAVYRGGAATLRIATSPDGLTTGQGLTGPTGPTGATGPTGPASTGPGTAAPSTGTTPGSSGAPASGPTASGSSGGGAPRGGGAPSGGGASGASAAGAAGGSGGAGASAGAGTGAGASAAASAANAVLTTTSVRRIVSVALKTSKTDLARVGSSVSLELPSGRRSQARIVSVGTVATAATGDSASASDATVEVTLRLLRSSGTSGLDQAPVTVRLERSRRKDVLAVPVTALQAQSGGGFAVEVREGSTTRVVPVDVGLYTSGYVEVSGQGLDEGQSVVNAGV